LYVVAIGPDAAHDADDLAASLNTKLGVRARTLPAKGLNKACFNESRSQFDSHCLLIRIYGSFQELVDDDNAVLIAVIGSDIYDPSISWAFAFSVSMKKGIALVSTARTSLPSNRYPAPDKTVASARLRKMALKSVGIYRYGLAPNKDPDGVMFDNILTLDDLDRMQERF
jgi:predicted Zn-dependent protease